jgi:NADH-quinone oxidoreductase subunit E
MQDGATDPLAQILDAFEGRRQDLIPALQAVQRTLGYLPEEALLEVARRTRLPSATVFGVATFYEQFRLKPVGRHVVRVCRGTACHVKGADRILGDLGARFGVEPGQTAEDGSFTLETVACFGSCALAPVLVVDETVTGRITPSKARELVEVLREAEPSSAPVEAAREG